MPMKPARICACGRRVASGEQCQCQRARKAEAERRRPSARARGYDTRWDKTRIGFLLSHPTCVMVAANGEPCGKPATIVDHIKPHRGNKLLFWDRTNWQSLCVSCHNSRKQSFERRQFNQGAYNV